MSPAHQRKVLTVTALTSRIKDSLEQSFPQVLVSGEILVQGTPDEVAADAEVRAVYLGEAPRG